jgi:hypothetical protein
MDALQKIIEVLLGQVTYGAIREVDDHWIERLNQVIRADEDYV